MIYRMRDIIGSCEVVIESAPKYIRVPVQRVKCGDCECIRDMEWTPEQGCANWRTDDEGA